LGSLSDKEPGGLPSKGGEKKEGLFRIAKLGGYGERGSKREGRPVKIRGGLKIRRGLILRGGLILKGGLKFTGGGQNLLFKVKFNLA
jgi:hypothetical protein